jgi:uncharacterized Zn finger protein
MRSALTIGCPKCGSCRKPLPWAIEPDGSRRTYRCMECGGRWSVDGVQAELFDLAAVEVLPLLLEAQ